MTEEPAVPQQRAASADDQALLARLRAGEDKAFSELFELHAAGVRRLARGLAAEESEAEDITAETFFRVLQALRRGSGPKDHIRAYLLTVARRVSWEWRGARRDVPVTDDELTSRAGAGADAHAGTAERNLIATAFTSLPERWRVVLWQTEVEGEQPAVVAPYFGLSANATAALARRARQGLRAAYLQAHLAMNQASDVGCRGVIDKLGGYTAGSVTGAEARRIRTHLRGCASCRAMHAELRDVCSSLRSHAGALAMLVPATAAAAATAAAKSGSGLFAVLKGMLVSKLKVGIALASTAAAGVVGFTVGPALVNSASHPVSLPGGVELKIAAPSSSLSGGSPSATMPLVQAAPESTVSPERTVDSSSTSRQPPVKASPAPKISSPSSAADVPPKSRSTPAEGSEGESRIDISTGSSAPYSASSGRSHAPGHTRTHVDPGSRGWPIWLWLGPPGDWPNHGGPILRSGGDGRGW
ncbi:sigma factor [Amycolatopsis taiwanensis]|uniref:RNA polymerase subunit sigma n=1 Tax=Amycolatopsis taiwanensis TaxID=342230 RepID=A0A9W6QY32_9PSEU|nr:sigma-70 family RNA polymerase sigma factor [Amycolatopsis taiwanensis]GLY64090.1 hypothetical protein Atai01_07090 [Amycolatopsis taiwanensis]